jgi:iron(III) transport system ATP-binding protein
MTDCKKQTSVAIKNLSKQFKRHDHKGFLTAVNDVSYEFNDRQLTTILGPSGCGKTTMLRMISGFETPTGGDIFIGEKNVTCVPPNRRDIAMVFQSYALFPHLTVYENIAYGLQVRGLRRTEIQQRVNQVIDLMRLNEMESRFPNQVSGGQQQRVALARAIVVEPRLLLFDEPLSNLDAKLREYMRDEIRKLQLRLGITSIYVTHDQSEAMAISDTVIIMNNGAIEQLGTPYEIYYRPVNRFVATFMGKANFLEGVLVDIEGDIGVVRIGDGVIRAGCPSGYCRVGNPCVVFIRPEAVSVVKAGGQVNATVEQMTFLGAVAEYELSVGKARLVAQTANPLSTGLLSVGGEVGLIFDEACARVLPEGGKTA